jgi:hypothetical protein
MERPFGLFTYRANYLILLVFKYRVAAERALRVRSPLRTGLTR